MVADIGETFTITLSIPADGNASVNETSKVATVTIIDYPTISIRAIDPFVIEGNTVSWEITSDIDLVPNFSFYVTQTETGGGDYLIPPSPASFVYLHRGGKSDIISLNTNPDNRMFEPNGVVTYTINPNLFYTIGTASTTMRMLDRSTPSDGISVVAVTETVTENGTNPAYAEFQIKAPNDSNVTSARKINIAVDQGSADFLDANSASTSQVTIPSGCSFSELTADGLG